MPNQEDHRKAFWLIIVNSIVIWKECWLCFLRRNVASITKEERIGSLRTRQQTTIIHCCMRMLLTFGQSTKMHLARHSKNGRMGKPVEKVALKSEPNNNQL
jgi:hypothetical protein